MVGGAGCYVCPTRPVRLCCTATRNLQAATSAQGGTPGASSTDARAFADDRATIASLPPCGGGMGRGVSANDSFDTPSRLAHAKSDVSDLAKVNVEIGNCRFRVTREATSPTSKSDVSDLDQSSITELGNTRVRAGEVSGASGQVCGTNGAAAHECV